METTEKPEQEAVRGSFEDQLLNKEKLEIYRRRIRAMLPSFSELQVRNIAYKKIINPTTDLAGKGLADKVYGNEFNYIVAVLSLPLKVTSPPAKDDKSEETGDCIDRIYRALAKEIKRIIKLEGQVDFDYPVWREHLEEFRKSIKNLSRLSLGEFRETLEDKPVGLALSGGGIRSASFNLGLIETLNENKLTQKIDYLSTVSGGGYIGTAWSLNSAREQSAFPLNRNKDGSDDRRITWLKSHGSYLTNGWEISSISLMASIFKGIAINVFVWLPLVLVGLWLLVPGLQSFYQGSSVDKHFFLGLTIPACLLLVLVQKAKERFVRRSFKLSMVQLLGVASVPVLLYLCLDKMYSLIVNDDHDWRLGTALALLGVFMLSILVVVDYGYDCVSENEKRSFRKDYIDKLYKEQNASYFLFEGLSWISVVGIASLFYDLMPFAELSIPGAIIFYTGLILLLKLSVNILFAAILSASRWHLHPEDQRMFVVQNGDLMMLSTIFLLLGGLPLIYENVNDLIRWAISAFGGSDSKESQWEKIITLLTAAVGAFSTIAGWTGREGTNDNTGKIAYLLRAGVTILLFVFALVTYGWIKQYDHGANSSISVFVWPYAVAAILCWCILVIFSNINKVSLHFYYRNRLADAFMSEPNVIKIRDKSGDLQIDDDAINYLASFGLDGSEDIKKLLHFVSINHKSTITLASAMKALHCESYTFISKNINLKDKDGKNILPEEEQDKCFALLAQHCGLNSVVREQLVAYLSSPAGHFSTYEELKSRLARLRYEPLGPGFTGEPTLVSVSPGRSGAPYPIINTNLVLLGSKDPRYKSQYGDSFSFTPQGLGAGPVGWSQSLVAEGQCIETVTRAGKMSLSTAMAISGAAVDPHVGATLSAPLRFLMTLLNVRLGYWMKSPTAINRELEAKERSKWAFAWEKVKELYHESWLVLIVREMFGLMHEKSDYVRLSDGGHFENLGLYELIRRRCKTIIVSDAGADPHSRFSDLARAILRVRSDFGVDIQIDYSDLKMNKSAAREEDKLAKSPVVVGMIHYPQREKQAAFTGYLILIKTNLFQHMDSADVLAYSASNPSFPDESTADQFFDEFQFEAYRQLGKKAAQRALPIIKLFFENRRLPSISVEVSHFQYERFR